MIFKLYRIQDGGGGGGDADFLKIGDFNGTDAIKLLVGNSSTLDLFSDKIQVREKIFLESNPIFFDSSENHSIRKVTDSTLNGIQIQAFANGSNQIFRVRSNTDNIIETYGRDPALGNTTIGNDGSVYIRNKLAVIRGGSVTVQNDSNDILTVKNSGFCKAIIHSDSGDTELALKCGTSNSNQAVIKRLTNDRFLINNQGEFRTVANNHNFFNNNSDASNGLRLAWQSDTNLVVYSNNVVLFASNDSQNSASSRDYKKNINDLVESESIDIIKNLNPVTFEYLEQYWTEHDRCNACNCDLRKGFIWEDTKPVLPQATRTINMNNPDEPTTKTLDLKMVIPDLTKTVQYLLNKVETLESTVSTLTQQLNKVDTLESTVSTLTQELNKVETLESTVSTLTQQLTTQSTLISNLQSQLDSN